MLDDELGPMTGSQWLRALLVVGLIILLTAKLGIWALVVLAGLLVSITLHELGHYLAAKRAGMMVTEFFLGFGPRIWSFRRGETEYGLKLIPAGAYVRIIGMNNLEEVEPEDEARTYRQANFPSRFLTVVAGVTMNALIAVVLIWVLLAVVGVTGGKVLPGPPEFRRRHPGGARGQPRGSGRARRRRPDPEHRRRHDHRLRPAALHRRPPHGGDRRPWCSCGTARSERSTSPPAATTCPTAPPAAGWASPPGTVPRPTERVNPIVAVPQSFVELGRFTGLTVQGLGRFFSPSGLADYGDQVVNASGEQEASPACTPTPATRPAGSGGGGGGSGSEAPNRLLSLVGLFQIGTDAPNIELLLFLFATLNITLAVINLIPLLPFDGGHIAVAVYERIQERRKRMQGRYFADVAKLLPLTYAVVLLLFLLMISSIYLDIASPITE